MLTAPCDQKQVVPSFLFWEACTVFRQLYLSTSPVCCTACMLRVCIVIYVQPASVMFSVIHREWLETKHVEFLDHGMTLSITWKRSGTFILHLCGVLWHYCTGNVGQYKEILKWSQQPLKASTVTGWCCLVYQFTFKMFLHNVTLHGLTLAQMCGCTQVRLAKLQAAAESSAHKHRQDSLAKAGEGHQGAVCKQLS